jgi:enoyl-CoA hydratase/carnithine racemase
MTTPDSPRGTDAPVLTRIDDRAGRVTLNRPSALHALNLEMCADMLRALLAWRGDRGVKAVLLDHAGERGFCAGGRHPGDRRGGHPGAGGGAGPSSGPSTS